MKETFDAILALLDAMGETSKRTEKETILSRTTEWEEQDLDILKATFIYALSPHHKLGLVDVSEIEPVKVDVENEVDFIFDILNKMRMRELTGDAAKAAVGHIFGSCSPSAIEVVRRIIDGNLKTGAGAKTINKIFDDLIYIHPYMRCSLLNGKTVDTVRYPCYSQTKLDGMYVDIVVTPDGVTYMSREGHVLPFNERSRDSLLITYASGYTIQGEALVLNEELDGWIERSKNNGYLGSDDIDINRVVFVCWDMIPNADHQLHKCSVPYASRLSMISGTVLRVTQHNERFLLLCNTKECENLDEVVEHFKEERAKGMEGTVVKNKDMIWKDGTSKDQMKLKVTAVADVKIIGSKEGEGKNAGMVGSLLCSSECGLVEFSVNCKTDAFREKATKEIDKWVEDGRIVSVIFNDIVENELKPELKSLYLPRMEADDIRSDKTEADTLERMQEILNNFEFLV